MDTDDSESEGPTGRCKEQEERRAVTSIVAAWSRKPQQVGVQTRFRSIIHQWTVVPNIATVGRLLPRDPVMR
jgi:hypothetical protein